MAKRKAPQKLLDYEEAAKLLCISATALKRKCDRKEVPYVKMGKLRRFDPEVLLLWMSRHAVAAGKGTS